MGRRELGFEELTFPSRSTTRLTCWLSATGATKFASAVETTATFFNPIADSNLPRLRRQEFSQSMATTSPITTFPLSSVMPESSNDCPEPRSLQVKLTGTKAILLTFSIMA